MQSVSESFVRELTGAQQELKVFVTILIGRLPDVMDVLQETNVDIWRKAATFDPSRPFLPWAKALARYQVMKWRSSQKREKLLFGDDLVDVIASEMVDDDDDQRAMLDALDHCVGKLTVLQQRYLTVKYTHRESIPKMAEIFGRSEPSVVSMLYRLRKLLYKCVKKTMELEDL
jgi:RNA polymerase sigma-70 factor (ECF subfamily)